MPAVSGNVSTREPRPPHEPMTNEDRQGLRRLLYDWALGHRDDAGERGIDAEMVLTRLDAIRDREGR